MECRILVVRSLKIVSFIKLEENGNGNGISFFLLLGKIICIVINLSFHFSSEDCLYQYFNAIECCGRTGMSGGTAVLFCFWPWNFVFETFGCTFYTLFFL